MPRKRAKQQRPRIHSWPGLDESGVKILGFSGYKAGMTHVLAIDRRKYSVTEGLEIMLPVTILETPPMKVAAIRAYTPGYQSTLTFTDVYAEIKQDLRGRLKLGKVESENKLKKIEENIDQISDIRLIAYTQPYQAGLPQKKPDIMELALSGDIQQKLELAKEKLGNEISIGEVFTEHQYVDVTAVTKGKGFQGVIKRWHNKLQPRKSSKKRRHLGTGGAWKPAHKLWMEPMPGQMGYHTRTEYNKLILKIGENPEEINPAGGFLHYGNVKSSFILLFGSVPGPAKRIVRLTYPRRPPAHKSEFEITHISLDSKQGS